MRVPGSRRRWLALGLIAVMAIAVFRYEDRAQTIDFYRVVDQQTILVDTSTPPTAWTRVTGVTENPTTIAITVSTIALTLPVAQADTRGFITLTVTLRDPLGDRAVIDGSNGLPVRQLTCEAGQSGWGCMSARPAIQPTPTDTADNTH